MRLREFCGLAELCSLVRPVCLSFCLGGDAVAPDFGILVLFFALGRWWLMRERNEKKEYFNARN